MTRRTAPDEAPRELEGQDTTKDPERQRLSSEEDAPEGGKDTIADDVVGLVSLQSLASKRESKSNFMSFTITSLTHRERFHYSELSNVFPSMFWEQ